MLLFIAKSFSTVTDYSIYADLPSFLSPSLITGDTLRPDLVLISRDKLVYILELTVGFESNLKINSDCKADKFKPLVKELSHRYRKLKFVNVSMRALGILDASCYSFE